MCQELNVDSVAVDSALLEEVNPVVDTAKMTLFELAETGDADAAKLAAAMHLTSEQTQNSATVTPPPEQVLGGTIMLETRYHIMSRLMEESGFTPVDLPCGYLPRAIAFAKKELPYYGLDLPAVIRETSELIPALIPEEQRKFVHLREVDATNYASLEKALEDIDGKVCITTEGLMMYFTESELAAFCGNIRDILEKKGGCWYTSDPEAVLQYALILKALVGEQRGKEILKNVNRLTGEKSDAVIGKNPVTVSPDDIVGSTRTAMAFLEKCGLKAERMIVAKRMPELRSFSRVTTAQASAIRSEMRHCAFWKITPSASAASTPSASAASTPSGARSPIEAPSPIEALSPIEASSPSEADGLAIHASFADGKLSLSLSGRLDTITAPKLLALFEDTKARHTIEAVTIDCSGLEYCSSAGLRVLLSAQKVMNQQGQMTILHVSDVIREIFDVTGFTDILTIE